jgi:hypothetical protein
MNRLFKTACAISILACAVFFAFGEVRTQNMRPTISNTQITPDGNLAHYFSGDGGFHGFENLFRDPAQVGPFTQYTNDILISKSANFWDRLQVGAAGTLLTYGDDPSTIFDHALTLYWGKIVETNTTFMPVLPGDVNQTYRGNGTFVTGGGGNVTTPTPSGLSKFKMAVFADDNTVQIVPTPVTWTNNTLVVPGLQVTGPVVLNGTVLPRGISSGTYTPIISAAVNTRGTFAYNAHWTQIGDIVSVDGQIGILPLVSGAPVTAEISLPVASDLAASEELSGMGATGASAINDRVAIIQAQTVHDHAIISAFMGGAPQVDYQFHFTYIVQ